MVVVSVGCEYMGGTCGSGLVSTSDEVECVKCVCGWFGAV